MKYIDAERLKAEIERRIANGQDGYGGNLKALIPFIDSLRQEQPDVDLEKEIDKYFSKWVQGASDEGCFNADSQLISIYDCHRIARYFAGWGATHFNTRKEE